ncbi:MAG: hypothetical protein Q4C20_01410 [Erysipelotrichaceae bacterium]|nr:hypothetical protein [Erysipelotrichaceae bacterium]
MFEEFDENYDEYTETIDFDDTELSDISSEEYESEVAELDSYLADDTSEESVDAESDEDEFSFDDISEDSYIGEGTDLSDETEDYELEEEIDFEFPEEVEQSAIDELLELPVDDQDDQPKVLTRDTDELMSIGMSTIESILDAKSDDYKDQGYEAEEIEKMLEQDRYELENEFMNDVSHSRR